MRDLYIDLLCSIIDEILMIGSTLLYHMHRRLQDVFENVLPFGGISVLTSGDLYQLKPVGDGYCFQGVSMEDSDEQVLAKSDIWKDYFQIYELTTILRQ